MNWYSAILERLQLFDESITNANKIFTLTENVKATHTHIRKIEIYRYISTYLYSYFESNHNLIYIEIEICIILQGL